MTTVINNYYSVVAPPTVGVATPATSTVAGGHMQDVFVTQTYDKINALAKLRREGPKGMRLTYNRRIRDLRDVIKSYERRTNGQQGGTNKQKKKQFKRRREPSRREPKRTSRSRSPRRSHESPSMERRSNRVVSVSPRPHRRAAHRRLW